MTRAPIESKDTSIVELVAAVRSQFGDAVEIVDYWDADLCAIGFRRRKNPTALIYVSTFGKSAGRYSAIVEGQPKPDQRDEEQEVTDCGFGELSSLISKTLA